MRPKNKAPLNALLIEKVILNHLLGATEQSPRVFRSMFKVVERLLLAVLRRSSQHSMLSDRKNSEPSGPAVGEADRVQMTNASHSSVMSRSCVVGFQDLAECSPLRSACGHSIS
jgi:hypothetical protein